MDYDDQRERSEFWDKVILGVSIVALLVAIGLSTALMLLS